MSSTNNSDYEIEQAKKRLTKQESKHGHIISILSIISAALLSLIFLLAFQELGEFDSELNFDMLIFPIVPTILGIVGFIRSKNRLDKSLSLCTVAIAVVIFVLTFKIVF